MNSKLRQIGRQRKFGRNWKRSSRLPKETRTEDESLDDEGALLREDETELELPEGFAAGESQLEWLHEDLSDDLSLEKEQEWERSEIEGEDFSDVSFEEEGSSKRIPISRSKASFSQVSMGVERRRSVPASHHYVARHGHHPVA